MGPQLTASSLEAFVAQEGFPRTPLLLRVSVTVQVSQGTHHEHLRQAKVQASPSSAWVAHLNGYGGGGVGGCQGGCVEFNLQWPTQRSISFPSSTIHMQDSKQTPQVTVTKIHPEEVPCESALKS